MPTCKFCEQPFGSHAAECPVKYRDQTNPDPEVQRLHELADDAYDRADPEP